VRVRQATVEDVPSLVALFQELDRMQADWRVFTPRPGFYDEVGAKYNEALADPDTVVLVARGHLRPADQLDRRLAGAGRTHQLRRHRLVAAAHQHHRVHRLGADHLLGVHGHEVAELHGIGGERGLVQRCGGELERQAAGRRHAALDGVQQLGKVAVAGIEARVRVGDADDGSRQLLARVAHRLGEGAAHVDREVAVAVGLQTLQEAAAFAAVRRIVRHGLSFRV